MFWSIFFNSAILIVAIMVIGWGGASLIEKAAKQNSSKNSGGK